MLDLMVPEFEGIRDSEPEEGDPPFAYSEAGGGGRDSLREPYAELPAHRDSHCKTEKHFQMSCAYHSATP